MLLSADYTSPGALEKFTIRGRLLWRYEPAGGQALDHPSLALPLPNLAAPYSLTQRFAANMRAP